MNITQKAKTREQVAHELGICRKTLYNWLKREGIQLSSGLLSPSEQKMIYERFGVLKEEEIQLPNITQTYPKRMR